MAIKTSPLLSHGCLVENLLRTKKSPSHECSFRIIRFFGIYILRFLDNTVLLGLETYPKLKHARSRPGRIPSNRGP